MDDLISTDKTKELLHRKISKAINSIEDETIQEIFLDYIKNEIENLYCDNSSFDEIINQQIKEVVRNMFIEKGLIKE